MFTSTAPSQILEFIKQHPNVTCDEISQKLKLSRSAAYRHLQSLLNTGHILKSGDTYQLTGGSQMVNFKTIAKTTSVEPPLVNLQVTNPLTYLKHWWQKIIGDEGVYLTLKIKPLVAIGTVLVIVGGSYGIAQLAAWQALKQTPIVGQYLVESGRQAALTGRLHYHPSNNTYYLLSFDLEAVRLSNIKNPNPITPLVNHSVLVVGEWFESTRELKVESVSLVE